MSQHRIAIVGLGSISEHQIEALEYIDQLELVSGCDTDRGKLDAFAKRFSLPAFDTLDNLVSQTRPDSVLVSVPIEAHHSVAREALELGCNVLIEKPPVRTIDEFDQLCGLSYNKQKLFYSCYHFAFSRDLLWFLEYWREHETALGPVTGFCAQFFDPYITDGQLEYGRQSLGSSWIDSGINALSVVLRIIPDMSIQKADFTKGEIHNCNDVKGAVCFRFGSSHNGKILTDWTSGIKLKRTTLFFSSCDVKIILDHNEQRVLRIPGLESKEDILVDFGAELRRQVARYIGVFSDFIAHLHCGRDNRDFSRYCLSYLLRAYQRR